MIEERTVELTVEESTPGTRTRRHRFIITLGQDGAEIRRESEPVVSRDTSVVAHVGNEPTFTTLVLRVEERP